MIVCIFGPSYAGKTTIARFAAAKIDLPLRSCGDAVRQMARTVGLSINQLPDHAHRAVDAASVDWVRGHHEGCMLEGRFLDAVFSAAGIAATLIELRADTRCRLQRARTRNGTSTFSEDDLCKLDAEDANFRLRLYGQYADHMPRRALDTSGRAVDECVRRLQEMIKA